MATTKSLRSHRFSHELVNRVSPRAIEQRPTEGAPLSVRGRTSDRAQKWTQHFYKEEGDKACHMPLKVYGEAEKAEMAEEAEEEEEEGEEVQE